MQVIGATRKGPPLQPVRPKEIWGWLQSYQTEKQKRVTQWVAIDDRELLMEQGGENLRGHFVNTNFATGLNDRCAERLVQVLNGNLEEGNGPASRASFARNASPTRAGGRARSPSPPPRADPIKGRAGAPPGVDKGGFGAALAATDNGSVGLPRQGATSPAAARAAAAYSPARPGSRSASPGALGGRRSGGDATPTALGINARRTPLANTAPALGASAGARPGLKSTVR